MKSEKGGILKPSLRSQLDLLSKDIFENISQEVLSIHWLIYNFVGIFPERGSFKVTKSSSVMEINAVISAC